MSSSAVAVPFRISRRALLRSFVANTPAFTLHLDGRPGGSHHQRSHRRQYHHRRHRSQSNNTPYSAIPIISIFFPAFWRSGSDETPDLSPFKYTRHRVSSTKRISPQHVLIDIPISSRSREAFRNGTSTDVEPAANGTAVVDVWHVYVKSPDLQIERPYTPINDVEKDGYARLLVKRVQGGEVGRYLHSLKEGDDVEIRGPIRTVSVPVESFDHLTMISTGTGVAPFLQLVCKIANLSSPANHTSTLDSMQHTLPKLSLIQYLPRIGHTAGAILPSAAASTQTATDSLPAEEFSDMESNSDAGPDIIRHPDVLSPVLRKHLTTTGVLRMLRVRAGKAIDSSLLINSLQTSSPVEATVDTPAKKSEEQVSSGIGSWFGWLSPSSNKSEIGSPIPRPPVEEMMLRDGKLGDQRVCVMTCLPLQ
ncbi:hypothetical protein QFC21_000598 [Naganishia friedmannii]|uniref:Uncharacterized protein n=1 Tax=Naganishia friedmannii TaxID=89922 RepID=A0ACC2WC28_9TREE|nr:hypothetical protein QFC21_000598 [Naganishia friedmannii]